MKNSKGQALVEFIIIVPILIFIVLSIIDFSNLAIKKMQLENNLNDVILYYEKNDINSINDLASKDDFSYTYDKNSNKTTIVLKKNVKINTPFLNLVLGNNHVIETQRIIYEE